MKKIFLFISIAAMAFGIAACEKPEVPDVNNITEDGFYVALDPTGKTPVTTKEIMAAGINEAADQSLRNGMYEKYIVLEAGKEFNLALVSGGKMTLYGASLSEFKADLSDPVYDSNPADAVFKGSLVIGDNAPRMKVSKTGLYHIVLDLNKAGDLDDAQIVVCPVTMGVRGGMNSWGFTALEATAASNDGITFTAKDQELAAGGEFKFAYNSAWKITLDKEGKVKANTNLGKDCKPGGDNIAVDKGAGKYTITLTYKLAAGDIANSFSYTIEQTEASSAPTTMYMIGQQFGTWDWASSDIVELVPIWGKAGEFWCTRYFNKADGFKFCSTKAWNGDFTGAGSAGYTVDGGNCFVPEDGFYTVYIDGNDNTVEISPAEVYGIGAAFSNPAEWDFDKAPKFVAEGQKLTIPTIAAEEVRLAVKVQPSVAKDGITGNGWYDWWKTEFIFFADGKIVYRGAGNDQDRIKAEAGKKIVLDFNAGTGAFEEGTPATASIKTADDFVAWVAQRTVDGVLEADINLPDSFVPDTLIANFDGKGHKVTYNLTVPTDSPYNGGLFSVVEGSVKNLKVAGKITSEVAFVGGVAGYAKDGAVFENCESSVDILGNIKVTYRAGGIVGNADKDIVIKNCVNNGEINHTIADLGAANACQLGGIIGHFESTGTIEGCTNNGKVVYSASGTPRLGGICGYINNLVDASFIDCTNNGEILMDSNGSGYCYYAGISGYYGTPTNGSHVLYKNCKNTGNINHTNGVSGTNNRVGGIMCHCGGTKVDIAQPLSVEVINCSNSGNITTSGTSAKQHIGGVIGFTETVTCIIKCDGCTNTGNITIEGAGTIGSIHGYSCNPASTFTNFTSGKDVVLTTSAKGKAGMFMGSGYVSTSAIPEAELNTAITGKVLGGKIVKGEEAVELTADNYKTLLYAAGVVGSTDGVTFGN